MRSEAAMFMASVAVDDCDNRAAERAKFFDLRMNEPLMMAMMGGMFAGPENAPSEAFDGHLRAMLINALTGLAHRVVTPADSLSRCLGRSCSNPVHGDAGQVR